MSLNFGFFGVCPVSDLGSEKVVGGSTHYGQVLGVLSLCSGTPRLVGDPAHAQTFDFPVVYGVVDGVTIQELIAIDGTCLPKIIAAARQLEQKGVRFITTSCGLYAAFQQDIANQLSVPFISSSLQMVSFLKGFLPAGMKVGVITAHAGLLRNEHVASSGFRLEEVVVRGMEDYPEFRRVVLEGVQEMDIKKFRRDVANVASSLKNCGEKIGLVVLECSNLVPFRSEIQKVLKAPVYDIVSLANFFAAGYQRATFPARYL